MVSDKIDAKLFTNIELLRQPAAKDSGSEGNCGADLELNIGQTFPMWKNFG